MGRVSSTRWFLASALIRCEETAKTKWTLNYIAYPHFGFPYSQNCNLRNADRLLPPAERCRFEFAYLLWCCSGANFAKSPMLASAADHTLDKHWNISIKYSLPQFLLVPPIPCGPFMRWTIFDLALRERYVGFPTSNGVDRRLMSMY